jgi:hypothetical protein
MKHDFLSTFSWQSLGLCHLFHSGVPASLYVGHSFPESIKPRAVIHKLKRANWVAAVQLFNLLDYYGFDRTSLSKLLNAIVLILGENSNTSTSSILVQQL